jgi:hypothetical protein
MGDIIKAPSHYVDGRKYEPKDVIRDWGLNFNLGSAVKYISRAGRKGDKLEDLRKAKQFLEFEIEAVETEDSKDNIGMTCKEAAVNGDAIAKSYEEAFKISEEIDKEIERKTSWYTNGILGQWYYYQNIPDKYKPRVIDRIAQEVLISGCDIDDISSDEVRAAVIDRIVEMVRNGELDLMDISDDLYDECVRSQAANANSVYCKALDGIRKYAVDTEDTVSINFEFEVDPDVDTDTVNVHVYIKNKED